MYLLQGANVIRISTKWLLRVHVLKGIEDWFDFEEVSNSIGCT